MSKLIAESGKIKKLDTFKAETFSVSFKIGAITPDGDIGEVRVKTADGSEFSLTYAQAVSLAKEILKRCQR